MKIALDGPAGAGKSTVAKAIAKQLNITYLDTGAMYRTVAVFMLSKGIEPEQADKVEQELENVKIEIKYEDGIQKMFLCGEDVSQKIRENHISGYASRFSAIPAVRVFLVRMQQELANKYDCILDGRDIGTCVLPDAEYKFFLTADSAERARRRTKELIEKGVEADFDKIKAEIEKRDYDDSHRAVSPLKQADDALLVDSTNMNADEVVEFIISKVKG